MSSAGERSRCSGRLTQPPPQHKGGKSQSIGRCDAARASEKNAGPSIGAWHKRLYNARLRSPISLLSPVGAPGADIAGRLFLCSSFSIPNTDAPPLDWTQLRSQFPALDQRVHGHRLVYLDNAATTQKPRRVIDAVAEFYRRDNSNVHRGLHELSNRATAAYEGARAAVARFLNAPSPRGVVFTRGTTEAINLVAQSWARPRLAPGDRILLTEMEHHSNIVPWQIVAGQTGARVVYLPVDAEGTLDLTRLDELLAPPTRLFAFTHVSNTLGTVNPAAHLCAAARASGVVTLIDAAQSAGHRPVDTAAIGCDFLAFSRHKACGPTGIGALCAREALLEEMTPWQGGGEMISSVSYETSQWREIPHRFEAGTPHIAGAVGLGAALAFLEETGRDRIAEHDSALARRALEQLRTLPGLRVLGPTGARAGIVTFTLADIHAHDIVEAANQHGVALRGGHHCNQPLLRKLGAPATARASFYLYNTADEIDRLAEVLLKVHSFFCHGS